MVQRARKCAKSTWFASKTTTAFLKGGGGGGEGEGERGGYLDSNKLALFSFCFPVLRFYKFLLVPSSVNKRYLDNQWEVN